jgi:LysM repeat protein
MSSIRPLITVIILTAVGAFLYVKINEAPLRPVPSAMQSTAQLTSEGVPPLDLKPSVAADAKVTTPAPNAPSIAPQWPGPMDEKPPQTTTNSNTTRADTVAAPELPPIPELPALPELPPIPGATDSPPASSVANARSNTQLGGNANVKPNDMAEKSATTRPAADSGGLSRGEAASATPQSEHDTAAENAMAAMGLTPQPNVGPAAAAPTAPSQSTAPSSSAPAATDRYGLGGSATALGSPSSPAGSTLPPASAAPASATPSTARSFASAWPAIDAALQKGELARAHQLLSQWYGDASLTPVEAQQVDKLLSQLAGTVIYSTEHRLEPPYIVRQGETLESIAKQHDVPWQLLAKINSIPPAEPLRPGQQLKVVRGPFEGVLDLRRSQLSLKLDGRYAGRFTISAPADAAFPPGEWRVVDKPAAPVARQSVYGSAAGSAAVARSLLLASASAAPASPGVQIQIGPAAAAGAVTGEVNGLRTDRAGPPYMVQVSPRDADELVDILSVGSRVVILR